jgi:hypothetical protein
MSPCSCRDAPSATGLCSRVLYAAGLRVSEVAGLTWSDQSGRSTPDRLNPICMLGQPVSVFMPARMAPFAPVEQPH